MTNIFTEETGLNNVKASQLDNIITKLIDKQTKTTIQHFYSINNVKNIIPTTLINKNIYFKVANIQYSINKNGCFISLPLLNEDDIYEAKLYMPTKMIILADNNTQNSLFFCKLKNGNIEKKIGNSMCIKNIFELYDTITQKPYFYNQSLKYNWSAKMNSTKLNVLILYEYKCELDTTLLNIPDITENSSVYYINLEKDTRRRNQIENSYKDLSPVRINAVKDNGGFTGLLKTNYYILTNLINKNLLQTCPVIMEDDCLLLDKPGVFTARWQKYREYLIHHWGEWNYFSGGSIYIEPIRIVNKDPCVVECSYGLCTQCIVHSEASSKKVIDYVNSNSMTKGIDRLLCDNNETFWVPYPFLSSQVLENSNISKHLKESVYLNILKKEFIKSQAKLKRFVECNINK